MGTETVETYLRYNILRLFLSGLIACAFLLNCNALAIAAEKQVVTVKTTGEFVSAIGSNRTIRLEPGAYFLKPQAQMSSRLTGQKFNITQYAAWEKIYHALKLVIHKEHIRKLLPHAKIYF